MGITVSGIGEATGSPDIVDIDVGVSVLAATVAEATKIASDKARAVTTSLTDAGITAEDLATNEYSIRPEYDYGGNEQRLLGYRVSNLMRARLRNIDATGSVLDAVASSGGDETRVNGQMDIWLIDPEGKVNVPLVTHARSDESPTWAPNSRHIAFSSTRRGRADVYAIDRDGSNLRRLTADAGNNTAPAWGPFPR